MGIMESAGFDKILIINEWTRAIREGKFDATAQILLSTLLWETPTVGATLMVARRGSPDDAGSSRARVLTNSKDTVGLGPTLTLVSGFSMNLRCLHPNTRHRLDALLSYLLYYQLCKWC